MLDVRGAALGLLLVVGLLMAAQPALAQSIHGEIAAVSGDRLRVQLRDTLTVDPGTEGRVMWTRTVGGETRQFAVALLTVDRVETPATGPWIAVGRIERQSETPRAGDEVRFSAVRSRTGRLRVRADPAGATAFVDGTPIGPVPAETTLVEGTYRVRLENTGFETRRQSVAIRGGTEQEVSMTLRRPLQVRLADVQDDAVRNVQLRRVDDELLVRYDLAGEADAYEVSLLLSTGSGSFSELRGTVRGAVGEEIPPGEANEILWAALQDYPEGLTGDAVRLRVQAKPEGGSGWLYAIGGTVLAGGGATVAAFLTGLLGGGDGGGGEGGGGYPTPPAPPGN